MIVENAQKSSNTIGQVKWNSILFNERENNKTSHYGKWSLSSMRKSGRCELDAQSITTGHWSEYLQGRRSLKRWWISSHGEKIAMNSFVYPHRDGFHRHFSVKYPRNDQQNLSERSKDGFVSFIPGIDWRNRSMVVRCHFHDGKEWHWLRTSRWWSVQCCFNQLNLIKHLTIQNKMVNIYP